MLRFLFDFTYKRQLVLLGLFAVAGCSEPVVTPSEYERLNYGMSYPQAVKTIGEPGIEDWRVSVPERPKINLYRWQNPDGSSVNVKFVNNELMTKTQFMLTSAPVVTPSEYEKLDYGMTYDQVIEIIGESSIESCASFLVPQEINLHQLTWASHKINLHQWQNPDGSTVKARFVDDKLAEKSQFMLIFDPVVTLSEYERLNDGITYGQAVEIIGESGFKELTSLPSEQPTVILYLWENPDGTYMKAEFVDNKLTNKFQVMLK